MVPGSFLYLFDHQFLFLGKVEDNSQHKHHAVQIVVGLDGPIILQFNNHTQSCRCAIVASDTSHKVCENETTQLLLLIDNESILARKLEERFFHKDNVHILDDFQAKQLRSRFIFPQRSAMSCVEAQFVVDELLDAIIDLHSLEIKKTYDSRIQKALDILQRSQLEKISARDIARQVCLSESRFIHLFTEEIGIPLRKYILWLRINRAIQKKTSGVSLTDAAYSSGFSDSAHLSRTFRSMFGLTLSSFFKNNRFVQVFSCLSS